MIDIFAYIGGFFAMVSFIPQITKAVQTESTKDISWLMLITTLASVVAYQAYAWALWLPPVLISNGVFIATVLVTIALKFHFDRRQVAI